MSKAIKAVAAVAVGVAVGFVAGPWAGVLAGAAMLSSALAKPPAMAKPSQAELKQIVRSAKEPARSVFGHIGTGALLAWAQEEPGGQTEGERLHLVYVLSEGEIEALEQIYLNQEPITAAGDRASFELVRNATTPNQFLLNNSPGWKTSQIGRGLSWVRLTLRYDPEFFAAGIPDVLFEIRGRRDIFDPRTGTTGYSDNAALVLLWYVRNRLGVPDSEILWETFEESANICDEVIVNPDGTSEKRYRIAGGIKDDERKDRVLMELEAACAGNLLRIGGKFGLMVGAYYGPYELEIDEDMVIGPVRGQAEVSQADAVNTMRGKFVDPAQRWAETDYPSVSVAQWVTEDGGPIEDTLDLRFVGSPYQAQRLANIALRRKRAGGALELPLNLRGYACRPGRVVRVALPRLNIDGEFRVVDWDFHGDSGCKVTLQQEDAQIYDDAVGQPYDPLGFISLPTGGVEAPSGLAYTEYVVGEVVQGRLTWNGVGAAVHYNVVIKRDGLAVQTAQVPAGVTQCDVGALAAGNYVAEVRTRGRLGLSGAATVAFSVATPPMPSTVAVHVTNETVTLIPRILNYAPPVQFEFRWAPSNMPLNEVEANATYLSIGASLVHAGRAWGTTYHYWIRSVNAYGKSEWHYLTAATTEDFEDILAKIDEDIRRPGGLYDNVINDATTAAEQAAGDAVSGVQQSLTDLAQQVESQFADVDAGFGEIERVQQDAEWLEAIRHSAAIAKTAAASAYIRTEQVVRVDETSSLALQITSLNADYQDNKAQVQQTLLAYADEISAVAQQTTALEASVGDEIARVDQELIAVYDDENGAVARAVTVVDVGNRKAVLGIQADGTVAEIGAVADRFYILNPVGGEYVLGFVVQDGEVIIPAGRIGNATITRAKIVDAAINAAKIANLAVTTAKIDNAAITQAKIDDLAVNNAKIANAAVDTLKVAGNSITVMASSFALGRQNFGDVGASTWTVLRSLTFTAHADDVLMIQFGASLVSTVSSASWGRIRLRRGSTELISLRAVLNITGVLDDPDRQATGYTYSESPGAGTHTYTLEGLIDNSSHSEVTRKRAYDRLIVILARRR